MGGRSFFIAVLVVLSALMTVPALADTYHLTMMLNKHVFSPGERIEIYGSLFNGSEAMNDTVTVYVNQSYSLTASNGTFYSRSGYYPDATLVLAPTTSGYYNMTVLFSNFNTSAVIYVAPAAIDNVIIEADRAIYYAGYTMAITLRARSGDIPVVGAALSGSVRNLTGSVVSGTEFSCTTNANGACGLSLAVPSAVGVYSIQTSDGLGYRIFSVNSFDVAVSVKDSTANADKYAFKRGEYGYMVVTVSYNQSLPTGSYTATGEIDDSSGNKVYELGSGTMTQNNSYVASLLFSVNSNFSTGSYRAKVSVAKEGGETVTAYSPFFEVRDWTLTVEKAATGSGFEYGYTTFPNRTIIFSAYPLDKSTSSVITGLSGSFSLEELAALAGC